jgi:hypothetical protein
MNEHELQDAFRGAVAMSDPPPSPTTGEMMAVVRRVRNRRRSTWAGVGCMLVALAIGAQILVWPRASGPDLPAGGRHASPAARPHGPAIAREAARILRRAVETPPAPSQFLYLKSVDSYGYPPKVRQSWTSVDGTRDGWLTERAQNPTDPQQAPHLTPDALLPGCVNGLVGIELKGNRPTQWVPCTPQPAYRTDLPTDADAMLSYLNARSTIRDNPGEKGRHLDPVRDLFVSSYLPPAALAALFEAVQRMPDLYLAGDIVDPVGRPVVAIGVRADTENRYELLFDADSYRYRGYRGVRTVVADGTETVTVYSTQIEATFVDAPRHTP